MMNKDLSKNILRAITIGITVTMTMMPTVGVLADDATEDSKGQEEGSHESDRSKDVDSSHDEVDKKADEVREEESREEERHNDDDDDRGDDSGTQEDTETGEDTPEITEETPTEPVAETPAEPAAETPAEPAAESPVDPAAETPAEPAAETPADPGVPMTAVVPANPVVPGAEATTPTPIADMLDSSAQDLEKIYEESLVVDGDTYKADQSISAYEDKVKDANDKLYAIEMGLGFTDTNISNAGSTVDKSLDTVKNADSGSAAAVDQTLSDSEKALQTAQTSLEAAAEKLQQVKAEVEEAERLKDQAENDVKIAKANLLALLKNNGISAEYNDEGTLEFDTTKIEDISDGTIRDALDKAYAAYGKASYDAEIANKNYEDKFKESVTGASAAYEQAWTAYNKAVEVNDDLSKNKTTYQKSLKEITDQRKLITEKNNKKWDNFRTLAFYLAKNSIIQEYKDAVDINRITVEKSRIENNIFIVDNDPGVKGFTVTYYVNDEKKTTFYNYEGFKSDNSNTQIQGEVDHINLFTVDKNGERTDIYSNDKETAKSFSDYLNSEESNNKTIAASTAMQAILDELILDDTLGAIDISDAETAENNIISAADSYAKSLQTAKDNVINAIEVRNKVQNELDSLVDPQDALKDEIKSRQDDVKAAVESNVDNKTLLKKCRQLAAVMVKYQLIQKGVDPSTIEIDKDDYDEITWHEGKNTNEHYGQVKYKQDGVDKIFYFDYLAYDSKNNFNALGGSNKDVAYIDVIEKAKKADGSLDLTVKYDEKAGPYIKGKTASDVITEYLSDLEDYSIKKSVYSSALGYANTVKDYADSLADLLETKIARENIRVKTEAAKVSVEKAAQALLKAEYSATVNGKILDDLRDRLKAAEDKYQEEKNKLDDVEKKYDQLKDAVEDYRENLKDGSGKKHKNNDEELDLDGGPILEVTTTEGVGLAPGVAAPGDVTPDVVLPGGPAVDTAAPAAAPAGETALEGDVLGDQEAPVIEGDVLGERMAPIIDAVKNGDFSRKMLFSEDGIKVPFAWWLLFLTFGAAGVGMYVKSRKKAKGGNYDTRS